MLAEMGVATGIDPERIVAASQDIATLLGITPQEPSRQRHATRKNVSQLATNNPNMRYS